MMIWSAKIHQKHVDLVPGQVLSPDGPPEFLAENRDSMVPALTRDVFPFKDDNLRQAKGGLECLDS